MFRLSGEACVLLRVPAELSRSSHRPERHQEGDELSFVVCAAAAAAVVVVVVVAVVVVVVVAVAVVVVVVVVSGAAKSHL